MTLSIALMIACIVLGGITGNLIARWRGLDLGAFTAGGFLLAAVAIPLSLVWRSPAGHTPTPGAKQNALWSLSVFVLALAACTYAATNGL